MPILKEFYIYHSGVRRKHMLIIQYNFFQVLKHSLHFGKQWLSFQKTLLCMILRQQKSALALGQQVTDLAHKRRKDIIIANAQLWYGLWNLPQCCSAPPQKAGRQVTPGALLVWNQYLALEKYFPTPIKSGFGFLRNFHCCRSSLFLKVIKFFIYFQILIV